MATLKREDNPNWKGGKTITSHGYVKIRLPAHPNADGAGYIYEHRLNAEKIMGRHIKSNEIVHHKNNCRTDNSLKNLTVEPGIAAHKAKHRPANSNRRLPTELNPVVLCGCGCKRVFNKFDSSGRPRKYIVGHGKRGQCSYDRNALVICACGCGQSLSKYDSSGRPRKHINGHNTNVHNPNPYIRK